jgi:hypothetical protein
MRKTKNVKGFCKRSGFTAVLKTDDEVISVFLLAFYCPKIDEDDIRCNVL